MNQFQQQLTKLRQAAGLSQEQLADQLHVSRQAISKWENGSALPDIEKIIQIASILHVSLDELVLAKEPSASSSWTGLSTPISSKTSRKITGVIRKSTTAGNFSPVTGGSSPPSAALFAALLAPLDKATAAT
ncbi:helix-turn-helix transcriptional regulator [uncultured Limosilactobacillus sp.]|uniref:helix-turn-helix domain-containing protein n=1 Tax=uncultured Limosilactobacillus sp. TaxID=2837629 RepID=UPI002592D892|nr:helix-turn-helix transcriptional regulator [uncultured Limosilactobacillus sp.]